jgi:hypothetical protein
MLDLERLRCARARQNDAATGSTGIRDCSDNAITIAPDAEP